MATRYYTFAEQEFYHIFNRGNSKQEIFKSEDDYERFKKTLYLANNSEPFVMRELDDVEVYTHERGTPLVHIGAYCCMPNHFHLLITPATPHGVPTFMNKLGTSYTLYFNKKYHRSGSLFEGAYKAKYADTDRYLKYLFAYVHLNPYRGKNGERVVPRELESYEHSSLPDYLGKERKVQNILSRSFFPEYFEGIRNHRLELGEWLDYSEN